MGLFISDKIGSLGGEERMARLKGLAEGFVTEAVMAGWGLEEARRYLEARWRVLVKEGRDGR